MIKLVDLEGGEMPVEKYSTRIEQIPYLVMRIGQILVDIKPHLVDQYKIPVYAFNVVSDYKQTLQHMLRDMEREGLPKGCSFFEVDGNKIFELRGPSGGVATMVVFYLMAR